MKHLVKLTISSYRGISIDAEHYYGRFHVTQKCSINENGGWYWTSSEKQKHPLEFKEVEYRISAKQAAELNKKDSSWGYDHVKGELSGRFSTREEVIAKAIVMFQAEAESGDILVMENLSDGLYVAYTGPSDIVNQINSPENRDYDKIQNILINEGYLTI